MSTEQRSQSVINFRTRGSIRGPVSINGTAVGMVKSFKFLGENIIKGLPWSNHIDAIANNSYK